jgi:pectate lyase
MRSPGALLLLLTSLAACASEPPPGAPGDDASVVDAPRDAALDLGAPRDVSLDLAPKPDAPPPPRDVALTDDLAVPPEDRAPLPEDRASPPKDRAAPLDVGLDAPIADRGDPVDRAAADVAADRADASACGSYPFDPAALLAERVGFGRSATGGDPRTVYRVRTTADSGAGSLREGLESATSQWIVFDIGVAARATITLRTPVRVRSNKTVDGRGRDVVVDGSVEMRSARNLIFTDLGFTNTTAPRCTQEGDVLSIRGPGASRPEDFESRDIWLNHLDVFNGGDGLLDIRGGSRVTVSWSHFRVHAKGMLFSMESAGAIEGREMEVTLHHNFFDRISRRGPQVTWGRVHFFNNYHFEWFEFGAASLAEAQFYSEANVYEARPGATCGLPFVGCRDPNPCGDSDYPVSKIAVSNDWATSRRGYVASVGDLLLDDARVAVNEPTRVFRPAARYPYTAEPATEALARSVREGAGARTRFCR